MRNFGYAFCPVLPVSDSRLSFAEIFAAGEYTAKLRCIIYSAAFGAKPRAVCSPEIRFADYVKFSDV